MLRDAAFARPTARERPADCYTPSLRIQARGTRGAEAHRDGEGTESREIGPKAPASLN